MALKKKNRVAPVMMNDLVAGQQYIELSVWSDGHLDLVVLTFLGRPYKYRCSQVSSLYGSWLLDTRGYGGYIHDSFASDLGVDPNRLHNSHRVFRMNNRNMAFLQDLVDRQALREYLEFIQEKDIAARIARMKEYEEDEEEFDDDDDIDPPIDMTRDLDGDWVPTDNY